MKDEVPLDIVTAALASPGAVIDFGDDGQPHLDAGASGAMHGTGCVALTGPPSPTAVAARHGVMLTTADVDMVRNRSKPVSKMNDALVRGDAALWAS